MKLLPKSCVLLAGAVAIWWALPVSTVQATTLGYFRAEDGPGSSHTTWVNSANPSAPGTSNGGSPVQNSTEVFGSVVPQTGAANTGSYYLDGTNAIEIGTGTDYSIGTGDFTIEFWFKTTGSSPDHPILIAKSSYFDQVDDWGVSIDDHDQDSIGGGIHSGGGGGVGGRIPQNVVDGDWYYFAAVLDRSASEFREYLDGELRVTDTWASGAADVTGTQSVYIGRRAGSTIPGHFTGYIDEVRITQAALQPNQFLNAVPEPSTGLLFATGLLGLGIHRRRAPRSDGRVS